MDVTNSIIYYFVFLIINLFLFKWSQRIEYRKTGLLYTNPFGVLIMFMAFIGTFLLLVIILIDSGIMDYKPKNK